MEIINENEQLDQLLPTQDPKDKRKSGYSRTIETVDDLLKNIELRNKCKTILGHGCDLTSDHFYTYEAEEKDEELVLLLEDLKFLKADWTGFKNNQRHRLIGNRLITIAVNGNKAIKFFDRISGKKTKISKTILKLIAHQLANSTKDDEFFELLESCGVPVTLFHYDENYPTNNEWIVAYDVLKLYASSQHPKDLQVVFRIMEKSAHPIMFGGDEEKSLEFRDKLSGYLQYAGYCFDDDGEIAKATEDMMKNIITRLKGRSTASDDSLENIKTSLALQRIIFNDNRAMITAGDMKCQLPPYKNEHFLCRAMFQFPPKEFIDWSIIYEKMENIKLTDEAKSDSKNKDKRAIQDAVYAINDRIKDVFNTNDKLFTWKEKSIARNY